MRKKRWLRRMLLTSLLVFVAACNPKEVKTQKSNNQLEETTESTEKGIQVEKNLLSVDVTLPALFAESEGEMGSLLEMNEEDKESGILKKVQNEDGSVTYTMSKAKHKKMMKEMRAGVADLKEELVNSTDFTSFKDITFDKKMQKIQVVVDREAFENSFDGFGVMGLGFYSLFYQVLDGQKSDKIQTVIEYVDETTNEVFESTVYPDAMENWGLDSTEDSQ